ncbi:amino acid adenylation domain-containing protein [Micromonospora halotolerans]|uniref:Amino acid adenylation domain-containing protein n=1 Tax=Micromonospora halotolerans TaxID=709879 RepID=A0ABY9ZVA9_9ACTN|nr:non-ribosomal peptide synthetase [Micromonospora halotolerans]WNM39241.1 amino acid adenylation domain-containing protein [Micromonospora halotolerans]
MTESVTTPAQRRVRELLERRAAAALRNGTTQPAQRIPPRAADAGPTPLSPAQARLWFLARFEPAGHAYNLPVVLALTGRLDAAALGDAVRDVAGRHDILRSVYREVDGEPRAWPRPVTEVPVVEVNVDAGQLDAAVAAEAARPFALADEPPMRAALFRVADEHHVLALTFHHIAMDATSTAVVLDDLAGCYAARLGTRPAPPPPALQYADVVAWAGSRPDTSAADLDWWCRQLTGLAPVLELPTDRPRPVTAGDDGAEVPVEVPPELTARLREVARVTGCTPFMVFLACWQALLARLAGTADVAVGVPESGRRHPGVERVVGCFVNTLVARTDLTGVGTGRELLATVRDTVLQAFAHPDVAFERIVERVAPRRSLDASPVFQVMLNVLDDLQPAPDLPGLAVRVTAPPVRSVKFDLNLALSRVAAGYRGGLAFRTDLFDRGTAERLARWFVALLDGVTADLDRPVAEVPLELVAGPVLAGPAAGPVTHRPVHRQIEENVDRCPDAVAVVGSTGLLTYRQLDERANRLAHRLLSLGVRADEPVGILLEQGTDVACAVLGIMKAGGAYLPMDTTYPPARTAGILRAAGARILLAEPGLGRDLPGVTVLTVDDAVAGRPYGRPQVAVDGHDLIHVIFTSGSTGAPKGVAVEHRNVAHYLAGMLPRLGDVAGASFAVVSTPAADFGLTCVYGALTTGGTVHLVDRDTAMYPEAFAAYLAEHPVDVLKCVPSHLELLARHGDLAAVLPRRLLILAGEACPWTLVERVERARPGLRVQSHYGHTESTMISMTCDVAGIPLAERVGYVPLGTPLPGVVGYLVDRAGAVVPAGVAGELMIGGPQIARGYLGDDELTASRFRPDPLGTGVRCFRSGDLLRVRPDGTVQFRGRADDQVKVRGHRVELGEVTAALRDLDGVAEAVVLPVGAGLDRRLAAWLVAEPGTELNVAVVRRTLRDRLPDYMVPTSLTVLDRLPLNANGKIDRAALPAAAAPPPPVRRPVASPAERLVARIWSEVLDLADVAADDDFFAVGGHSFAAVRAAGRLGEALRRDVPVRTVFEHPVLADLAVVLQSRAGDGFGGAPIPMRPDPEAPAPLSSAQARLWFLDLLEPGPAYHTDLVLRLRGPVDADALALAVHDVAARHVVLRSLIEERDGIPTAVPVPAERLPVPIVDIPADRVDAACAAELQRPFALDREPPLRATLFRITPDHHVLALTVHHIATDNWSRGIIGADLAAAYVDRVAGRAPALPPPVQYADYAAWLVGRQRTEDLDWWCTRLADLPPVLALPTDRPRPAVADWSGDHLRFALPAGLVEQLRRVAAEVGVTPFMVLLTCWQELLGRLAGTDDVAVGVPEAGRHHPDVESTVGCFVNTLVLRTDLGGEPTVRELLNRVRETVLGAFAHAETPLERIIERLQPDRSVAATPLFQVLLNVLDQPAAPPRIPGLDVTVARATTDRVKFDLSMVLVSDGDSYLGGLAYRTDLFDPSTVDGIAADFQRLLAGMLADVDAPVRPIPAGPDGRGTRPARNHIGRAAPELSPAATATAVRAPGTPSELRVAAVWAEVLDVADFGVDDDFFALGGHSFTAVRAVRLLDERLRVIDLFLHPTVRQLAAYLDAGAGQQAGEAGLLHRLSPARTDGPPDVTLICVPYGGGSAAVFQPLANELAAGPGIAIEVRAVELPGHDAARPDEAFCTVDEIVARLADEIARTVSGPVAVYGHCVGSAVATALAARLEADGRSVMGVVVAGSFPAARLPGRLSAWLQRRFPRERWVADRLYRDTLRATGGLLDDMDEQASAAALRALRHDAAQAQAWFGTRLQAEAGQSPRPSAPVLCIVGSSDPATELYQERYREWGAFGDRVELAVLPKAGHYFLRHQAAEAAELLRTRLARWAAGDLPARVDDVPVGGEQARRGLRAFYTVAGGQAVSQIGNELSAFALGVWAYQRSGRVVDLALVVLLARVPAMLLTPVGGALADRVDRRRIMLCCELVSGAAMALLAVLVAMQRLDLVAVCTIVGVTSLATAFHQPAYLAAIAQLVPKPYLPQANGLANIGGGVGTVLGPILGGVLMGLSGLTSVVVVDVATFAVGVVTLLVVRFPNRLFFTQQEPFAKAVTGGLLFVLRRRPLLVMIGYFAVVNYFTALMWVALTPLVLSIGSPAHLGLVSAIGGVGAAVGALVVIGWGGTARRATGMLAFVVGSGAGVLLMGAWPSVAVIAIGLFIRLACMSIGNAHWLSIIQTKVGQQLQGRVLAINVMLATAMQPLGFLTAGPLADELFGPAARRVGALDPLTANNAHAGVAGLMVASGVVLVVWGVLGLRYRPLRRIEDLLPDAPPPAEIDDDLDRVQALADRTLVR